MFDCKYYLKEYPDVRRENIDPIAHYLIYGAKEFRNPSKSFNTYQFVSFLKANNINIKDHNPFVFFILNKDKLQKEYNFRILEDGTVTHNDIRDPVLARTHTDIKDCFSSSCVSIDFEILSNINTGRFKINCDTLDYEVAYFDSKNEYLYVYLSSARSKKDYPTFNRTSYCKFFDGASLYIDDPSRILNSNENIDTICFYYGTKYNSALLGISKIIKKICSIKNIKHSNITFISSSNGGFASLYLSTIFEGSKCIALNTQVSVLQYFKSMNRLDQFYIFNKKYSSENFKQNHEDSKRFNIVPKLTQERLKSKILIFWNISSHSDNDQLLYLKEMLNLNLQIGFNIISNYLYLFILNISCSDPHTCMPMESFCKIADLFLNDKISIKDSTLLFNSFIPELKRYYDFLKK